MNAVDVMFIGFATVDVIHFVAQLFAEYLVAYPERFATLFFGSGNQNLIAFGEIRSKGIGERAV
jgi:hypothetical protein